MLRTLLAGLAATLVTAGLVLFGALEPAELGTLNRLFALRGPRPVAAPIVIVTIDEDSFDELNLAWPFPRALHAKLVDILASGHPLAIAFDVLFPEPSTRGPEDDQALGRAVARAGNVVLGAAITDVSESFYDKTDMNMPVVEVRQGAAAVAPVNHTVDIDGELRRAVVRHRLGDETFEAWDTKLYQIARRSGIPVAPLPPTDAFFINFRGGPRTFPWVPYHRVVNGDVPPEAFQGKIVLIGATTLALQDIFSTPFARARAMPGVEVHANALDTLIRGDYVRPVSENVILAVVVLAAMGGAWLAARLRALRALGAVVVLWVAAVVWTYVAFAVWNVWFRGVGISLGLLLGYGTAVIDNFVREQRERRRLSQFFSPAVLTEIVRNQEEAALASDRRLVTVLFSDIRGFTSISEQVEPEVMVELLREYLTEMTEVVFRHGGTVDKYIGDCIMALYNVPFEDPQHAVNAVRTGLEFQERTLAVSARWEQKLGAQIRNGVGINTGEAVVGTMGSRQRLEYTAIGDTVNLASRLEGLTKEYRSSIIISESTHEYVAGHFLTRELGEVPVKGKALPVKLYAVLPADIRKYPRAILEAAALITARGSGQQASVRTLDVSEGGLSLAGVPDAWTVGSVVQVHCEGGALPKPILAEGTIVWRRDERVGVSFTVVEPDTAPAISQYIDRRNRP